MASRLIEIPSALSDTRELAQAQLALSRCEEEMRFARSQMVAIRLASLFERVPALAYVSYKVNPSTRQVSHFDTNLREEIDALAYRLYGASEEDPEDVYERLIKAREIAIPALSGLLESLEPKARLALSDQRLERHKPGQSAVDCAMRQILNAGDFSLWQARVLEDNALAASLAPKRPGL